jgi:hypothetical protein
MNRRYQTNSMLYAKFRIADIAGTDVVSVVFTSFVNLGKQTKGGGYYYNEFGNLERFSYIERDGRVTIQDLPYQEMLSNRSRFGPSITKIII